jgi:hypothetical protein
MDGKDLGKKIAAQILSLGFLLRFAFTEPGQPVLLRAVTSCYVYLLC